MSRRVVALPALLAALSVIAIAPAYAQATVSNVHAWICGSTCFFDRLTSGTAGAQVKYYVEFTLPAGFDGDTDTILIAGPSGTVFPGTAGEYSIDYGTAGYSVNPFKSDAIVRSNGNATVAIKPYNGSLNVEPGDTIAVQLGVFGNTSQLPTSAGSKTMFVATTLESGADSSSYTVVPADAAQLSIGAGDTQSTTVDTAFAGPLTAHLTDQFGNAIEGKTVTFAAPESGASGTFADDTVDTNAGGDAAATVTANTVAGDWEGTASVTAGSNPQATFDLTNDPGPAQSVDVALEPSTIIADGLATSTATATVEDEFGNPVAGDTVGFSSDGSAPVGTTADAGDGTYSAVIGPSMTPGAETITAADTTPDPNQAGSADLTLDADTAGPTAAIDSGPSGKIKKKKVTFKFSSPDEDLAGFECRLDKKDWADCNSPATYKVGKGHHRFVVRGVDLVGNRGEGDGTRFRRR